LSYLLFVSLVWAFSFGIIKDNLAVIDPNFIAFARLLIALLAFLPFLRLKGLPVKLALRLGLTGMLQYGLMYISYQYAFGYLKAYEVALFTILTPIYIALINNFMRRHFYWLPVLTALLAVAGAAVVEQASLSQGGVVLGFLIVQVSNICFAFGQVYYKELTSQHPEIKDYQVFGLLYLGGVALTALSTIVFTKWQTVTFTTTQLLSLLYLGLIASGVCFFLWNFAARKVNIGALAIFNNLKIPLAIAVSLIFFQEKANLPSLLTGGLIMLAALLINEVGVSRISMPHSINAQG
jgi:drug/metabolite transporter (DMT)-like permease